MAAHYDTYDYPSYWEGREYEHGSELIAIKAFLEKIPKLSTILEIGAGYGRITPTYLHRAKKIILTDPSAKLLKMARASFGRRKNITFIHSNIEGLRTKIRSQSADLVIMVRVLHHIEDVTAAIEAVCRTLKNRGYFILEFPNKKHFKATLREFLKGNLTFPLEIFPQDKRSPGSIRRSAIPFYNYHPEDIKLKLKECGFKIIEVRSVSNIRSAFLKKIIPLKTLLTLSKYLQKPLSLINFGPSIFILAQKRD